MKAAHTIESSTGLNKKTGIILVLLGFVLIAIVSGYFLVNQVQNPVKRADEGEGISLVGPSCPANGFICRWDREPGVTYHYTIRDSEGALVKEGDIPASSGTDKITVTHTPDTGKTYTCTVAATNDCGFVSDEESATCSSSPQPTLIKSPTPVVSLSITPSITPSGTISPTLSPTPSPTLPPNVTPSKTPTPTDIVIVNTTNTPQPSQQTQVTDKQKSTTNPTLPTSGSLPSVPILMIVLAGFVVIVFGLLL